jgi:transposase
MSRARNKLDLSGEGGELLEVLKKERVGWKRDRLIATRLGLEGKLSLQEIAEATGHSRSTIQRWFDGYRKGGIAGLLEGSRYGHRAGGPSALTSEAEAGMVKGLEKGEWRTGSQVQRYLKEAHGIKVKLVTVYKYLKKCRGRLKVPRPSHIKKKEAKGKAFRKGLTKALSKLKIEKGRPVRLWVVDEMRYGLQPLTRRVWSLRGTRVVVPVCPAYEWGYLYGALQVAGGGSEFFYSPKVNLDCSRLFLNQISRRDPAAFHVIIWDGARFHHKELDSSLPQNLAFIQLPAYSPELNPIEKLWDIVKDSICNQIFPTLLHLEEALSKTLSSYWNNARKVFALIGSKNWLISQANAS